MKNILFEDFPTFLEGKNYFTAGEFKSALEKFTQFSKEHPNSMAFVAGRIAITLMKLKRFGEAKDYLKTILRANKMPYPDKERDYNCLYAECLYALGESNQAEEVCFKIKKVHPAPNEELDKLLKKVSVHPYFDILRYEINWNESEECLEAIENIIEILVDDGDKEEACQYSLTLLNYEKNQSIVPYLVLADSYNGKGKYYNCLHLLDKLEKSVIPLVERTNAFNKILSVYKHSPCYPNSKYCPESKSASIWNPVEKFMEVIAEKVQQFSFADFWAKYLPVLDLDKYFALEPLSYPNS